MTFKSIIFTLLIFSVMSCTKEISVTEQASNVVVVKGYLNVGESIHDVSIENLLTIDEASLEMHDDIRVMLEEGDNVYELEGNNGMYAHPDASVIVQPNTTYTLKVETPEGLLIGRTETPMSKGDVSQTATELRTDVVDQIDIYIGEDQGAEKVFYIVNITPLADELIPIQSNSTPLNNAREAWIEDGNGYIPLRTSFFQYLGAHRIDIERVKYDFIDLFKGSQSNGFISNEGNIQNGYGYFVGKDSFSVEVDLVD